LFELAYRTPGFECAQLFVSYHACIDAVPDSSYIAQLVHIVYGCT